MKKGILFFAVLAFFFSSCEKVALTQAEEVDLSEKVDRLSFDSKEAFRSVMLEMSDAERNALSHRLKTTLFSEVSSLNIEDDPVLSCDFRDVLQTKAGTRFKSLYELGNYEDLIPDEKLAALLNARGEIEVGGIIYKIAEEGTYYYAKKRVDAFNRNYESFRSMKGSRIDIMTEKLGDGIFRYDTFRTDRAEDTPEVPLSPQPETKGLYYGQPPTPAIVSQLQLLDYGQYPRYCSDAKTWLGNIIQSIFGRNKSFDYSFSDDWRFTSKFYYYDYLFWESIGAVTKYQKKGFLGIWSQKPAKEIYVGWGDIVLETDIKGNPLEFPKNAPVSCVQGKQYNKYTKADEDVAYVLGLYLSQEDIDKAVGYGVKALLSTIKSKVGQDVSGNDKVCVVGPRKIYTIIPASGKANTDVSKVSETFYFDPTIYVSSEYFSLPSGVGGFFAWLAKIVKDYLDMPNTRLVSGSVQTAVKTPEGKIGAMSIIKPEKK